VGEEVPEPLREAVNILERAKDATVYATMQIALKYMQNPQALTEEQEFIEYLANLMIDLYATDSALARAIKVTKQGHEQSEIHIKLAQLATWTAITRLRGNLDQLIITYIDEARASKVLSRTRTYIGDYMINGVKLQREIAALVVEKQGYPL
jgi:hypothetical protein